MNAVTAILLSLLVHLGGVELDTTREASLQWYRDSELAGQWGLEGTSQAGAYRFVSDEGLLIVERLREANMTYALQQFETRVPADDEITAPIPRSLRSLGTVSLQPQAQNLLPSRSAGGRLTVDVDRMPVAWTRVMQATEAPADVAAVSDSAARTGSETVSTSAPGGTVVVSITPGQWSASHADSAQVMVLLVR